jgi:hypothetical protein
MEAIIKHKRKDAWSGVIKYKSCFDYICPSLTRSGNIHTGLTAEDADRLEKELNLGAGTLAPYSKYWTNFIVKITNTELPWDELRYLFLKNHHRVAAGLGDMKSGADYVLINKDEEALESNKINKKKREAIKEFDKMSLDEMRKCLRLFGFKTDALSAELVESKLFEQIENAPDKFFSKWVNNKTRNTEFMIEAAVAKNIIRKNKNAYYYGTDIIGTSLEDAVSYIDDKKNQDLKMTILNESESK